MEESSNQNLPLILMMKKKMSGATHKGPSDEPFLGNTGSNVHINNPESVEVVSAITGDNNTSI
jgi:hypothetical protein